MNPRILLVEDDADAAREIRSERDVPVVYLTAYADDVTLRKVARTRPYGYVVKPYDARILRGAVEIALARHRLGRKLMEVALEGVEHRTQYESVRLDGPDFLQGHYTGSPVEPDRFEVVPGAQAR